MTLREAAATGTLYRVKALLDAGADIEQSDEHGQTPLMFAVAAGHVEVVKMLCAAGANVHATRGEAVAISGPVPLPSPMRRSCVV